MVGIKIRNRFNQNDKPIGISFRRKDPLAGDVIRTLFDNVSNETRDSKPRKSLQLLTFP